MNSAAIFQIYKIHLKNEYEPPFRGAGGQKRDGMRIIMSGRRAKITE
jgi:hypothetical protein